MIDILIDLLTPCLIDRTTNQSMDTLYKYVKKEGIISLNNEEFWYDWNTYDLKNKERYVLTLKDDTQIQGLVALENIKKNQAVHINLMESAPHNRGENKEYLGVGGHLFAIAIEQSVKYGYEGFIYFEAKNTSLIKHYEESFGAIFLGIGHPYRMIIDEEAAKSLLARYTLIRSE